MKNRSRLFIIGALVIACQSRESVSPNGVGAVPDDAEASVETGGSPEAMAPGEEGGAAASGAVRSRAPSMSPRRGAMLLTVQRRIL
jgi:hypothetical protein